MGFLILGLLIFSGCAHWEDLTEEEKEAYRKARISYEAGQRGGP